MNSGERKDLHRTPAPRLWGGEEQEKGQGANLWGEEAAGLRLGGAVAGRALAESAPGIPKTACVNLEGGAGRGT